MPRGYLCRGISLGFFAEGGNHADEAYDPRGPLQFDNSFADSRGGGPCKRPPSTPMNNTSGSASTNGKSPRASNIAHSKTQPRVAGQIQKGKSFPSDNSTTTRLVPLPTGNSRWTMGPVNRRKRSRSKPSRPIKEFCEGDELLELFKIGDMEVPVLVKLNKRLKTRRLSVNSD